MGWQLPECFVTLRRLLEARLKKHGSREYIQVLRLLETFALEEVTDAVEHALRLGHDQLRRCEASAAVPHRAPAAAAGPGNWPHLPLARCAPRRPPITWPCSAALSRLPVTLEAAL